MIVSRLKLALCGSFFASVSLYSVNANWTATSSSNLQTTTNWTPNSIPTGGVATFDSTVPGVSLSPETSTASLSVENFTFSNRANFVFTVTGPYNLTFSGVNAGIIGTNSNTTITASDSTTQNVSQIIFSGTNISTGEASLYALLQSAATFASNGSSTSLAQVIFDASGDSSYKTSAVVMNGSGGGVYANAYTSILSDQTQFNNIGQIIFDGSGGVSASSGGTGSSTVTLGGNTFLSAELAASSNGYIYNESNANNVAQVMFDGSGGLSYHSGQGGRGYSNVTIEDQVQINAALLSTNYIYSEELCNNLAQIGFDGSGGVSYAAGGTGQSIVVIKGSAALSATTTGNSFIGDDNEGYLNDAAQILFNGNGGVSYGASGHGSSQVTITDSATLSAYNTYYLTVAPDDSVNAANDCAQILFDGSGGTGYGAPGFGSSTVTIDGSAQVSATNAVSGSLIYLEGYYSNDLAQILFDGSAGYSYKGGTGSSSVTIGGSAQVSATNEGGASGGMRTYGYYSNDVGQILFDGSGGASGYAGPSSGVDKGSSTVIIQGNALVSAVNASGTPIEASYGNVCGQVIFDGSGGFGYSRAGVGFAEVTLQGSAQVIATNAGSVITSGETIGNIAQIMFNGDGGSGSGGTGECIVGMSDAVSIQATNSGALGNASTSINNTAQILFDGGGGLNGFGTGHGFLDATIGGSTSISAVNESSGTIEHGAGSTSNKIGQVIFDGSKGYNTSYLSSGDLVAEFTGSSSITVSNSGTIGASGGATVQGLGQIVIDGSGGTAGSGSCMFQLSDTASIQASNSGSIQVSGGATTQGLAQILFDGRPYLTSGVCKLELGEGTAVSAINTSTGSVQGNQVTFYNTTIEGAGVIEATNQGAGSITGGQVAFYNTVIDGNVSIEATNQEKNSVAGDQIAFHNTTVQGNGTVQVTGESSGHGVAFYGSTATGGNLQVQLTGASMWLDSTVSPSFTIGALSGNASSSAILNQNCTIDTISGASAVFEGSLSGVGSLSITGAGQQVLAGTQSYTGATDVSSGTLTLRNSNIPSSLSVAKGGTFSGVGTVVGPASIQGTVKPGNSPGTLTFADGLTISSSAITQIEIDTTQASLLAITKGNASIAGALQILEDPGVHVGKTFPVITATNGAIAGTFDEISYTGKLLPVVGYSADMVTLTLQNIPSSFVALLIAPDRILRNMETLKHIDNRREDVQECDKKRPWSVYVEPTGSFGHVKSRQDVPGNSFQTAGARVGFDYLSSDASPSRTWSYGVGFIAEYNHWWGQLYESAGTFSSDVAYGSFYSTFVPKAVEALSLNLIGGGGYGWYTFHRYPVGTYSFQTRGLPGGAQGDLLFDIEYSFCHENLHFTPIAALQYTYNCINRYKEAGAGIFDLNIGRQKVQTLSSLLGARMSYVFLANSDVSVRPEIFAEWEYQYLDSSVNTSCGSVAPGAGPGYTPFAIPQFARSSLVGGADLRIDLYDKAFIQVNYDLWYNKDGINNFFLIEFGAEF